MRVLRPGAVGLPASLYVSPGSKMLLERIKKNCTIMMQGIKTPVTAISALEIVPKT